MTTFRAGLLTIVVIAVLSFFGFTKANPFANPYELNAVFLDSNNLKPRSPVRIAGVEVGKVVKVDPLTSGRGASKITMEIKKKGLPIHTDATLKVRPRIFLEGNFFVDIQPGSPSAKTLKTGSTIPIQQTAAPVQFGDLLAALQSDTREDLQVFLKEYSRALQQGGADGFNESVKYWEEAYKNTSLANDATLGEEPTKDLQRVLKGQQRTFAALVEDEEALKGLVTNFNVTAGAFAQEDVALEASVPALRDTLRVAQPALASVNGALPTLRAFAREALPGVRSSNPTLRESLPFISQARALMSKRELRGLAAELRAATPSLVRLTNRSVSFMGQARSLSRCTSRVLVPFFRSRIPNVEEPDNNNQMVREQTQRGFAGLAGESRLSDGNTQFFHTSAVAPTNPTSPEVPRVRPGPPTDLGATPPPHRPDVPCETQEIPNMHAPGGPVTSFPATGGGAAARSFQPIQQIKVGKNKVRSVRSYTSGAKPSKASFDRIARAFQNLNKSAKVMKDAERQARKRWNKRHAAP